MTQYLNQEISSASDGFKGTAAVLIGFIPHETENRVYFHSLVKESPQQPPAGSFLFVSRFRSRK